MIKPAPFSVKTIAALFILSMSVVGLGYSPAAFATDTVTYVETVYKDEFEDEEPVVVEEDAPRTANAVAQFGPFSVINPELVEMAGMIDGSTPGAFRRMITAYPNIKTIRMIDCPGSEDDDANLALSRMVRRAGINTIVPHKGSVRSGAVEFFLAGVTRKVEPGAEVGVHSWKDDMGREAQDYPANDPVHAAYVNFYVDMGIPRDKALAFYNFTNAAAPADGVHYMSPTEIARFGLANAQ